MNVCVAGSRTLDPVWRQTIFDLLNWIRPDYVVSGGANGPDSWGIEWALDPHTPCRGSAVWAADWDQGRSAGVKRTWEMLSQVKPDLTIVLWDGDSPGTRHTLTFLGELGLDYMLIHTDEQTPDLIREKFFADHLLRH